MILIHRKNAISNKVYYLVTLIFILACSPEQGMVTVDPVDYVNPFIGTAIATTPSAIKHSVSGSELRGQTYPAVGVPHGMTQWTPETQSTELKCKSPYYYEDSLITGFRGTHWMSGSCTQDYGSVSLMPFTGDVLVDPMQRGSPYEKIREEASPNEYSVHLGKYGVDVSISATSRAGILKINYNGADSPGLSITPNSDEGLGYVRVDVVNQLVVGYNPVHRIYQGWGDSAGFSGYFVIAFSKPFKSFGTWNDEELVENKHEVIGTESKVGAYIQFETQQEVMVKVGTSFTSIEGAMANLLAEIPDWNYEAVRVNSAEAWNGVLSKIEVKGDEAKKELFYTALYHSYLLPRVFSDHDGTYVGFAEDSVIRKADHDYYVDFSMWDTFRSVHPLMTILEPGKTADMVNSVVLKAEQGGWLPIFPSWNSYTAAMIGDHVISMIGDAYSKGITSFDTSKAWKYMQQNAFVYNSDERSYISGKGRRALDTYLKYDFIHMQEKIPHSFHKQEQVSRTLEYAYDDFVLAQYAKNLNKPEYAELMRRAENWENVFDKSTGYVRGKNQDGSWFAPFDPNATRTPFITEGTPFQYTWYVPHDIYGLMDAMGGKEKYISQLDQLFESEEYWHGNEPGHQTAYMYVHAGNAWKTQHRISDIINNEYGVGPGGLSGNEDAGQMSAWLVFSMTGFYPVCPGTPYYIVGAPSFEEATLTLENGNRFTIQAKNLSASNFYIQSATLNGESFNRSWIEHQQLLNGGLLVFEMGPKPNPSWASDPNSLPLDLMSNP